MTDKKVERQRKWWGWGYSDESLNAAFVSRVKAMLKRHLGREDFEASCAPRLEDIILAPSRVRLDPGLSDFCTEAVEDRLSHAYGKSYQDTIRAMRGQFDHAPDVVAYPRYEQEIIDLMAFCERQQLALIPYGGGTSVVGGVEPTTSPRYNGNITVDLRNLNRILEIDPVSRCAHVQAGILGPALEAGLRQHGLTLRHFPQSFEFSSVGGWIATRAAGHFATLFTHIDEFVESVRMVTPKGILETRRVPSSGAGPSPEKLILGSEGILGVITETWLKVQAVPLFKVSATVLFENMEDGFAAVRMISQSGLFPSNCRLISSFEALGMGLGDGMHTILILGFESHDHPVDAGIGRSLDICSQFNGKRERSRTGVTRDDSGIELASEVRWRNAFLQGPYLRDYLVSLGLIVDTFETAVTWDRFASFHHGVVKSVKKAIDTYCGKGFVTWRLTHVYPDGPVPYYTVIADSRQGQEIEQWRKIKAAASDAVLAYGGTITHHHAVGKEHRPWYEKERAPLFGSMLGNAKQAVDPHWILNPDVLISSS